ncbi:hypothetical protein GPALN_011251 [Globodera pallida]|nr:hypothetical protein GPALN_011251 [Globodera pallida]
MSEEQPLLESSLRNVLDNRSLRWIFVGGKGGVGKTTCSCSLAVQLAKYRRTVLIISTDPAHNISDAFNQKFSRNPTQVNGFDNLFAMEVDGSGLGEPSALNLGSEDEKDVFAIGKNLLADFASGLPGVDEATSFSQMIKLIRSMDFEVVLFDTAPTGHTLRLLQFPTVIEKGLSKFLKAKTQFMPIISQMAPMLGLPDSSLDSTTDKLEDTLQVVRQIRDEFRNPELTTFVCVCIAEFLSMYETERLVQELTKQEIDVHNIIVNQLLFPDTNSDGTVSCKKCHSRFKVQQRYLAQIAELYEDFHITKLPLLEEEVRGTEMIRQFSERLVSPSAAADE